jgi:hypothetical protein
MFTLWPAAQVTVVFHEILKKTNSQFTVTPSEHSTKRGTKRKHFYVEPAN